ncbi:MAG: helix-turn-helix domain-containing protein [Marinovum sp.]|nr:helix-turn-helix domain-containing protein [Marinovum sp.]
MPSSETAFLYAVPSGSAIWPSWLPDEVKHHLNHVECGAPLRELARRADCHPSTIMRQVRRVESRRDDPLVDAALRYFGRDSVDPQVTEVKSAVTDVGESPEPCYENTLRQEGTRVLRRLCESGTVLAVVPDMEKAVVVRETSTGSTQRVAVIDRAVAQAMALKDWIACKRPGRIARYVITATGRTVLSQMLARQESQRSAEASGLAEAGSTFLHADPVAPGAEPTGSTTRRVRYGLAETPLSVLGRRRGRDGQPFLEPELVAAGDRLREDFELAQMGARVTQDWRKFLTGPMVASGSSGGEGPLAASEARARLEDALHELGPGLGDMAMRCCCLLEGLEVAEREMGWAARSGKVLLRIALQRLKRFYETKGGARGGMIG